MGKKNTHKLKELLNVLSSKKVSGDVDLSIKKIECDSRRVKPGDLFVAIEGYTEDGHKHVHSAVKNGAVAVVAQRNGNYKPKAKVIVPDTREALALLASRFYGCPSKKLKMVGITGTNGKTTISYLIRSILERNKNQVGLIGTIAYWIGEEESKAINTTPESLELQRMFSEMLKQGIPAVVMEVSSHALVMHRVDGIEFDVAIFTNLNHEHLDFHKTMDAYRQAKGLLFRKLRAKGGSGVINMDDPNWRYFGQQAGRECLTYSINDPSADFFTTGYTCTPENTLITMATPAGEMKLDFKLIGESNIYNALASAAAGFALNVDPQIIKTGLEAVTGVVGRMERIQAGQDFNIWIDYAHTPHAFERLLKSARRITKGQLLFLFGCGGDRDREKRPLMGKVAARYADGIILTEDNPRSEDPEAIVKHIMEGIEEKNKVEVIIDRREGIQRALKTARPGDTLVLAGKGHENYQAIGDKKIHFSDKETVLELLSSESAENASENVDSSEGGK
ncbi:MAG: UDP-N-acetylmuramoyl-L-alanyl-D-glutamate--2,6-diaminopimelate ligase [Candidatus Zixiibacteriota bacterium]|nr:MAG: UDP-N-acetylmuramoyl-L-alanyl-D-glutamate--2,6-diaminopimelate ligase [candidate division Zixibacteria bacterium]